MKMTIESRLVPITFHGDLCDSDFVYQAIELENEVRRIEHEATQKLLQIRDVVKHVGVQDAVRIAKGVR